ncbi:MAG: cyclic nucleotide-binding domain-containing protein [Deltaproteobacteria bacterium]|nr:cyclic nucleotide-binding domain-containing protein [Deltaproteobacteria bacterium]
MITAERLAQSWFFKGFARAQIDTLLANGQEVSYPAGEKVLVEREPAESFHILVQGAVSIKMRIEEHGELVLSTLTQSGEIFGWSALVEGGRFTATAECLEESRIISFKRKNLEDLFTRDPNLGYLFMKRLALLISRRLEGTRTLWLKEIS